MGDELVKGLATVSTGDDHRQADFLTKGFQTVYTEAAKIGLCLRRRGVVDAVLACGCTVDELMFCEVRRVLLVACFLFHVAIHF